MTKHFGTELAQFAATFLKQTKIKNFITLLASFLKNIKNSVQVKILRYRIPEPAESQKDFLNKPSKIDYLPKILNGEKKKKNM